MVSGRHSAKAKARVARDQARELARAGARADSPYADGGARPWSASRPRAPIPERADFSHLSEGGARLATLQRHGRVGLLRRRSRLVLTVSVIAVVALVCAGFCYRFYEDQVIPGGPPGRGVVVDIPSGATEAGAADLLAARKVIAHPLIFRLYLRLHPVRMLRAGPYEFRTHDAYASIEKTLAAGPNPTLDDARLLIPEGLTVDQVAARVGDIKGHSAASFLSALSGGEVHSTFLPASAPGGSPGASDERWEGILFPDTYFVSPGETDVEIAQQMADQFEQTASSLGLVAGAPAQGLTPSQVITVASIVQREAKSPSDMAKVAEVIYNRLKVGMKLQLDSTVDYALAQQGETVTSEITDAQESIPSPYNTYVISGLPPGPISLPGNAALEAALHPTAGPWLYYVTIDRQGDLAFATSLAGQNANIAIAAHNGCPAAC